MPVSKNRKGHAKKANQRKTRIQQNKNRLNRLYKGMIDELKSKPTSVVDMLNKEEEAGGLPNSPEQTTIPT